MAAHPPLSLQRALATRYRFVRGLAHGGMGAVYLAEDLKHRRPVAIKVLDPEIGSLMGPEWFLREIGIAARLSHPHIVPLFDSGAVDGLLYYVMPYVEGESLRERLKRETRLQPEQVLGFTREVGDALDHAHRQGLVHRDVKPENILLSNGHSLVADFGLARAIDSASSGLTRTGTAVGTPLYMSPEQVLGGVVDGRSDLYSLACVVYESMAGRPPFVADSLESILYKHCNEEPRPVSDLCADASDAVVQALQRALSKQAVDRFPSVRSFIDALEGREPARPTSGRPPRRIMLAVLPLQDLGGDADQEYFNDGMTDELIQQLARLGPKQLGVIARTSAMRYKKSTKSVIEIGRELGVDYVIEGSVRRSANQVRIGVQLVRVSDQTQIWGEAYHRTLADMLSLQSDIASQIARSLAVELLPPPTTPAPTSSPAAYEAYLKGRYYWHRRTPEALQQAITYFLKSIELDPSYARPHAGLADSYLLLASQLAVPDQAGLQIAQVEAKRAIELDPSLAEAHTSLAASLCECARDWTGAEAEFLKAIELDPGYAVAHHWYGRMLTCLGRFDEAEKQLERASGIDPFSASTLAATGELLLCQRDYGGAAERYRQALDLAPGSQLMRLMIGLAEAHRGRYAEALAQIDLALERGRTPVAVAQLAYACALSGRSDEARRVLRELERGEPVRADLIAAIYAALGDRDGAFRLLERAVAEPGYGMLDLKVGPRFDRLRDDPRYAKLLDRLGMQS